MYARYQVGKSIYKKICYKLYSNYELLDSGSNKNKKKTKENINTKSN